MLETGNPAIRQRSFYSECPNPCVPQLRYTRYSSSSRKAQVFRRSQFLAAARALIAEGGKDLALRNLADRSELSVQTIYNLVGNRLDVIENAICEHIEGVAESLHAHAHYSNVFLSLSDSIWMSVANYPEYAKYSTITSSEKEAYFRIQSRSSKKIGKFDQ